MSITLIYKKTCHAHYESTTTYRDISHEAAVEKNHQTTNVWISLISDSEDLKQESTTLIFGMGVSFPGEQSVKKTCMGCSTSLLLFEHPSYTRPIVELNQKMWHDQGKRVACRIFQFLFSCTNFSYFNMLHFDPNPITNGYLVTELWRIWQC